MAACIQNGQDHGITRLTRQLHTLYSKKQEPGRYVKQPFLPLLNPQSDLVDIGDNEEDLSHEELDVLMEEVESELAQLNEDANQGTSSNGNKPISPSNMDNTTTDIATNGSPSTSSLGASDVAKEKELDWHTLKRLQALIKVLLQSPSAKAQFDLDHIKESVFKGYSFSDYQLQVTLKITNVL